MAQWVQARLAFFAEVDRPRRRRGGRWEEMVERALVLCGSVGPVDGEAAMEVDGEGGKGGGGGHDQEQCFLCEGQVVVDPHLNLTVRCERNHVLGRCMETFLIINTPEYWECPLCNSMARPMLPAVVVGEGGERGGGRGEEGGEGHESMSAGNFLQRPSWLRPWQTRGMSCLFCNVPCRLVNT